jgi:hypothetical protein
MDLIGRHADERTLARRSADRHAGAEVVEVADEAGLRSAFLTHGGELYGYARR